MKKTQRTFAVEYKSGRRKLDARPNSIWGTLDLRSVARDVEDEAMPFLLTRIEMDVSGPELSVPFANPQLPSLTPSEATPTTAEEPKGMSMVDDTDTLNDAEVLGLEEAPVAAKKQRKPQAKKTAVFTPTADSAPSGTDGPKKRGRKPRVSKETTPVEPTAPKLPPQADQIAGDTAPSAGDEMADLLQLETENQQLRKMLAEKLRAENADLRRKLNLD